MGCLGSTPGHSIFYEILRSADRALLHLYVGTPSQTLLRVLFEKSTLRTSKNFYSPKCSTFILYI